MDNKHTQLDFKLLVEQSVSLLDSLSAASRCDALHYLLQSLKCKYPQACDQVVRNIYPHIVGNEYASSTKSANKRQLQLLLSTKKEEIKTEDEGSTDLNQNFEKILCKEEFMCLDGDEEEVVAGGAADVENSSSQLSKRLCYASRTANRDPLDLIPSSVIDTRRLAKTVKYHASYAASGGVNAAGFSIGEIEPLAGNEYPNSCDVITSIAPKRGMALKPLARVHHTVSHNHSSHRYPPCLLSEKLVLSRRPSKLGESYVFHPDSELIIHYHHSTGEFNVRAYKEHFRFRLQAAHSHNHKSFLQQFCKNFIMSGQLLGTTPPTHVLRQLRQQRQEEWQLQRQRLLAAVMLRSKRHILPVPALASSSNAVLYFDSEELESETDSQLSSSAQEIMKFEEIMDEGEGQLIDGLEMEPEMDEDMLGGNSSTSSSGALGVGLLLPGGLATTPESVSTLGTSLVGGAGDTGTNTSTSSNSNHLQHTQQPQQQEGNNNLAINGLTTTSNNTSNLNGQQLENIAGNTLPILAPKEQQQQFHSNVPTQQPQQRLQQSPQQQLHQHHQQHMFSLQHMQDVQHHMPSESLNFKHQSPVHMATGSKNILPMSTQPKPQIDNNSNMDILSPQHQQQPFGLHQQRLLAHKQQQQQNHFCSSLQQQQQDHPLVMMGGMMENAAQQHLQQACLQQNATTSLMNSIDSILESGNSRPSSVSQLHQQQHIQHVHLQQQQQQPQQQSPHQQHMLMQPHQLSSSVVGTSASALGGAASISAVNIGVVTGAGTNTSSSSSSAQHNVSLDLEDAELSHDEDDDENEHDLDDLELSKQQLIDGGSSSSTSLQAPLGGTAQSGTLAAGGAGVKKAKPSYNCLLCPKLYRKRKSLLDHYKIHPGYCHDCGQQNGTSLEEIIDHNRTVHSKEFPFVCETCGESYSRRQQFLAHVESHNKKEFKTYSCVECGQKFPHKKLHQQHLETTGHKADGAICEVCGAEFPSKNALHQHIMRVHKKDNLFECHICQNRFTLKANLERHVQLHTEVKRTHVCDLCGSSYFTYLALKDHYSNAHTDASECKCTLCGKRFGSVKSLQRHLPSHSEERPHCCCYCDQTFKWKTHLVRHKQTVHGNQPSPKKVKRFAKVDEELIPVPDMPGPPPAKVAKKSNSSKPKQPPQNQQQLQKSVGAISTPPPPPLSTTPGTSSQQEQFNAAMISNSSSQSSTASTSQHSLATSDSQQNSMYSQNFSADKLIGQQQQQQCNQSTPLHAQQQQQQIQQQQQRPTPPPPPQQHGQHRLTPNRSTPEGNLIVRINNFAGAPSSGQATPEFHFGENAAAMAPSAAASYQQHQLINQYQQQHHQQQQQHLRSQTPQSPHQQQLQQHQHQHFTSPHHMPPTPQQQQQMHHHHQQQLLHQHQLQQQQQQQQHRHNQQRSPHHHHQTAAQQLQHQHQQPSHSPQHVSRLQSPQPQSHTPQPPQPQQQQQYQQQQQQQPQQQPGDAWGSLGGFVTPATTPGGQPQQQNAAHLANDAVKDNSKFYIVDSAEFLGIPINVGGAGTTQTATAAAGQSTAQQTTAGLSGVSSKQQHQSQQQQDQNLGNDLLSFQNIWSQSAPPSNQMVFGGGPQQQQQQQQQQSSQAGNVGGSAGDPHNYNNIGSILTNLIDNQPNPMEYNFELLPPGVADGQATVPGSVAQTQQQNAVASHHHQQQHHAATSGGAYGLQPSAGASALMRHASVYGASGGGGVGVGLYEAQQQNSFQPYHTHVGLQSHPLGGGGGHHPLAPTAHHPLASSAHLLPPPPPHAGSVYERGGVGGGYPVLGGGGDESKTVLPPISDYMHHMQQQQQLTHPQQQQQPDLIYYPAKVGHHD